MKKLKTILAITLLQSIMIPSFAQQNNDILMTSSTSQDCQRVVGTVKNIVATIGSNNGNITLTINNDGTFSIDKKYLSQNLTILMVIGNNGTRWLANGSAKIENGNTLTVNNCLPPPSSF